MQNQESADFKIKQLALLFARKMKQITKNTIYLRRKKTEKDMKFIRRRITRSSDLLE